jgi:hypothetical protein
MRSTGDPYLVLLDPTGRVVGRDDDGGVGLDARLVHTFARTGRYTVVATSYRPEATFDYDLTVSALGAPGDPASDPVRLSLAANATTVEAGTPVAFTVTRADTGAPVNATLARDGETWVTGANGTALVPFDRPGTYRITATKPPTATERFAPDRVAVTVDPAATAAPPRFDVSSLSIPETVRAGETVRVAATVTNTGGRAGSSTVRAGVDLDGDGTLDPVGRERVDLDPGARHAFDRSVTVPGGIAPGRYAVGVRTANGTVTTTVTVADERG